MTMKMRLRLVYAEGDAAANLLRPLEAMELHVHFCCVFESFLYKIRSSTGSYSVECRHSKTMDKLPQVDIFQM